MNNLRTLAIFSNGLSGEFGSLVICNNEFLQKQKDLTTKQAQLIEAMTKMLLDLVRGDDRYNSFTVVTGKESKTLLYELVENSINFDEDKTQKAHFCRSPYLFVGNGKSESSAIFAQEMNELGQKFLPVAQFSCHPQIGGICFEFTLLQKISA